MSAEEREKHYEELARQDDLEHRDVLLSIKALLKTKEGQQLFKYLFKNLDITCTPDKMMEGNELSEYLGFLRAGNSIYKLACEADPDMSASLLSKLERERYERLYTEHRLNSTD